MPSMSDFNKDMQKQVESRSMLKVDEGESKAAP